MQPSQTGLLVARKPAHQLPLQGEFNQGAATEKSALPSYLQSLSARRGTHVVDVADPWRELRDDSHIGCHSSVVAAEIAQAHPS